MASKPTLEVPENFDEYDHDVQAVVLANNSATDLRDAVDNILGASDGGHEANVTKEWLAQCLLALGGPDTAGVEVNYGDE